MLINLQFQYHVVVDIAIQADLVEEIARIYGYENLPTTLPQAAGTAGELTATQNCVVKCAQSQKQQVCLKSYHML